MGPQGIIILVVLGVCAVAIILTSIFRKPKQSEPSQANKENSNK